MDANDKLINEMFILKVKICVWKFYIDLVKNLYLIYFTHPIRFHVTHPHQFILFQNQLLKNELNQSVRSVELGIKVVSGRTNFENQTILKSVYKLGYWE